MSVTDWLYMHAYNYRTQLLHRLREELQRRNEAVIKPLSSSGLVSTWQWLSALYDVFSAFCTEIKTGKTL